MLHAVASRSADHGDAREAAAPAPLRKNVERVTGVPLAGVRLHVGCEAQRAAAGVGARAFAAGRDVYFGEGAYRPGTPQGDLLIAHELTHAAQQGVAEVPPERSLSLGDPYDATERQAEALATAALTPAAAEGAAGARHLGGLTTTRPRIARALAQVQTEGIALDLAEMTRWKGSSYWFQKVAGAFSVTTIGVDRLSTDPEERDAVLSLAWAENQKLTHPIASSKTVVISVPSRRAGTHAVAYRLTFSPAGPRQTKPQLAIEFLTEDAGAAAVAVGTPATAPGLPARWMESGFPTGGLRAYQTRFPAEVAQLFQWINTAAPNGTFAQLVHTTTTGRTTHHSTFVAKGTKSASGVTGIEVDLVEQAAPLPVSAAAGYDRKEFADLQLEQSQAKRTDHLGAVMGLDALPVDERLPAKFAVWQYFESSKPTRNAEVDAVVPIPGTTRRVLLTLRFAGGTNDVSVQRIGEEGRDVTLDPATRKMDVRRVRDFDPRADATKLRSWLATRYPGVTPAGTSAPDIVADVNRKMEANAGTPAWFKSNYAVDVLDAAAAATRLTSKHTLDAAQARDTKNFTPGELRLVEMGLEMLSQAILKILSGISLLRQRVLINRIVRRVGATTHILHPEEPKTAGQTMQTGTDRTVRLFDSMTMNDASLFIGGRSGTAVSAAPLSEMTVLHELGHVTGYSASIQTKFNALFVDARATLKTAPVTWYAASAPSTEFFPEAFAIYNADPEWMRTNLPRMFQWFEQLSRTGTAP